MQTPATWVVEPRPWEDPEGGALRLAQRAELDERFGCDDHEPGPAPSSEDIAVFLVAVDPRGEAVGCGALREIDAATAEVKRMYVTPASRGTGAARAILTALEATARERGWTTLRLETGDEHHQPDANRFYEREGYHRIPRFGHYVDSEISNCYEKRLT
ncbi:GNAT family N-acetyltransferase [Glycomyces sp. TRM65418]|uniref:GNAT family N-acetyltransferase n=1 Tax=Glycomyces sp. TRM65418 TaxID=2867006 RepID=UPI001CE5AA62|nr:GNAT family N-acetyltransferase [Glycomyces sp. TRM65418]MCC3765218.1 GNAT family N-acetyltransferase [Glycomyces sp. TRM65418]QZD54843.1 GNAT family N-acetyltransferase [Glycomyces sp. TRM65418]